MFYVCCMFRRISELVIIVKPNILYHDIKAHARRLERVIDLNTPVSKFFK